MFNTYNNDDINYPENILTIDIIEDLTRVVTDEIIDELSRFDIEEEPSRFKPATKEEIENIKVETYTDSESDNKCAICLDRIKINEQYCRTKCDHLFHHKCLIGWLNTDNSCPICRDRLETSGQSLENSSDCLSDIDLILESDEISEYDNDSL